MYDNNQKFIMEQLMPMLYICTCLKDKLIY